MFLFARRRLSTFVRPLLWSIALLVFAPALFAAPIASDVLVYKDGDRVLGRLVSNDGGVIVFRSNRFGELRVPSTQAKVIPAGAPGPVDAVVAAAVPSTAGTSTAPAEEKADAELAEQRLLVARLSTKLRHFFGPWHGRVAFTSEVVSDTTNRHSEVLEGRMERKWVGDDVRFETRYEFSSTDDKTSTDITKGGAYWRHDLSHRWFTLVHPSTEWNRNYVVDGTNADYFLLQDELGGGLTIWDRPGKTFRVGLSENLYDVWNLNSDGHSAHNIESLFIEAEFRLPWNVKLTERGIRYFSLNGGHMGWESQLEISKKFSENLVLALRHEVRRKQPEIHVQDFALWRLLIGLDF
jgi:hypothetical protein